MQVKADGRCIRELFLVKSVLPDEEIDGRYELLKVRSLSKNDKSPGGVQLPLFAAVVVLTFSMCKSCFNARLADLWERRGLHGRHQC